MSVLQTQLLITTRLTLIEDVQERLAIVIDRVRKVPPLTDSQRTEDVRVQGCVSRVWLLASLEEERCRFRVDADSTVVRGLASLICEVYDDATPADILAHDSSILEVLHLTDHLTPTRRHGLEQVRRTIRDFAMRNHAEMAAGLSLVLRLISTEPAFRLPFRCNSATRTIISTMRVLTGKPCFPPSPRPGAASPTAPVKRIGRRWPILPQPIPAACSLPSGSTPGMWRAARNIGAKTCAAAWRRLPADDR